MLQKSETCILLGNTANGLMEQFHEIVVNSYRYLIEVFNRILSVLFCLPLLSSFDAVLTEFDEFGESDPSILEY